MDLNRSISHLSLSFGSSLLPNHHDGSGKRARLELVSGNQWVASTSATPLASSSLGGSSSNSPRLTLSEALKEKLVELDVGQQVRLKTTAH